MSERVLADPCLLFALRRESGAFRRQFRPQQRLRGAPCPAWSCGPPGRRVLVLETGIGPARTAHALEWLWGQPVRGALSCCPRFILSAGFAGALQDGYGVGDVIFATEVVDQLGNRWPATWPGDLPSSNGCPALHRGRILTATHLITTPQHKQALGRQYDALAVDMETASVARLCQQHGVRFGCVRAISDDVHTALSSRLLSILARGRTSPLRLCLALLASPRLALELWRLAWQTHLAAKQLAKVLRELLTRTLP